MPIGDAGPSVFSILAARRVIEGEVAALAAQAPRAGDLRALKDLIAEQKDAITQGRSAHAEDRRFHLAIAAMAGNEVLTGIVGMVWADMFTPVFERLALKTTGPGKARSTLADHEAILAALTARDPAQARAAMHDHIAHTEALFLDEPPSARTRRRGASA
ncbi:MAG: FCD domain-containing protein [Acetobacteraceae bacterium]